MPDVEARAIPPRTTALDSTDCQVGEAAADDDDFASALAIDLRLAAARTGLIPGS